MLTELFPYCLNISVGQMSSDNGLPHVSLEVSIEDTKHEGLFSLKKLLFLRFTTWSIVGIEDLIALMGLGNYEQAPLEAIKVSFILREGYAATSLLIPFLKPISSVAAGEYPVGLDEGMGLDGTGSGPLGLGKFWIK